MLYLHHWRLNWTHEWRSPAASERAAPMFKLAGRNRPEAEISPQTSRSRLYLPVIRTRGPGHFAYLGHENGRLWCSRPSVRWSVIDTPSRQFSSTFQILIWKLYANMRKKEIFDSSKSFQFVKIMILCFILEKRFKSKNWKVCFRKKCFSSKIWNATYTCCQNILHSRFKFSNNSSSL